MKPATLLLAMALAGCSTIGDLWKDRAQGTYTSARSPAALEQCLAGSLSWVSAPSVVHGEGSTELAFGRGYGDTFLLITLQRSSTGTAIEVREQDHYGGRIRHSLEGCV